MADFIKLLALFKYHSVRHFASANSSANFCLSKIFQSPAFKNFVYHLQKQYFSNLDEVEMLTRQSNSQRHAR